MDIHKGYAIDVQYKQLMKCGQHVFGDTFLCRKIREEGRWIVVLSDGLGSGIKANVLSTLTATMAMKFTSGFRDIKKSAEIIMKTLPVCSERKISYATFTIVDIEDGGEVHIINYDNPDPVLLRKGVRADLPVTYDGGVVKGREYRLGLSQCTLQPDDRILLLSDGITQAGMGSENYPLGWGVASAAFWAEQAIVDNPFIAAGALARKVVNRGNEIDGYKAHDDATCGVIHSRARQELLLVTGPPVDCERDHQLAEMVHTFAGKKIVCGGTTAKIIARELDRQIQFVPETHRSSLPPRSSIAGIDMVTEGIITLHSVEAMLDKRVPVDAAGNSTARTIADLMLESDHIRFVLGTRINEAWQDPALPDDIGLRRTIVARIRKLLENSYQKETSVTVW